MRPTFFAVVIGAALLDLVEDYRNDMPASHFIGEILIVGAILLLAHGAWLAAVATTKMAAQPSHAQAATPLQRPMAVSPLHLVATAPSSPAPTLYAAAPASVPVAAHLPTTTAGALALATAPAVARPTPRERVREHFDAWGLTASEEDVAMHLLDGLSLRAIADRRDTSERTVRQQAQEVYRKAGLDGRAALSAYVLRELLEPAAGRAERT
jgi:DNA-binding CsgD family transcriptional regulator